MTLTLSKTELLRIIENLPDDARIAAVSSMASEAIEFNEDFIQEIEENYMEELDLPDDTTHVIEFL